MNNHMEHHLFPAMPKGRLRKARRITREFCHQSDIPYREMGWWAACKELHYFLKDMADAACSEEQCDEIRDPAPG